MPMEVGQVERAYRFCAQIARAKAKNFYYAFRILPEPKRNAIYAAYAFSRECDDLIDDNPRATSELMDECRRELAECYAGSPRGEVAIALADAVRRYPIPIEYFQELIRGIEMDVTVHRYPDFRTLYHYCYGVAATVGLICLEIFGYSDQYARKFAVDLGVGMQLTNILRDVKEDWERGRVYLPQDELAEAGCREDVFRLGVLYPDQRLMLARFAARSRAYLDRSRALFPLVDSDSRLCPIILHALYSRVLDKIVASGYNVFEGRIGLSTKEKLLLVGNLWVKHQLRQQAAA